MPRTVLSVNANGPSSHPYGIFQTFGAILKYAYDKYPKYVDLRIVCHPYRYDVWHLMDMVADECVAVIVEHPLGD